MDRQQLIAIIIAAYAIIGTVIGLFFYGYFPTLLPTVVLTISFAGVFYFIVFGDQDMWRRRGVHIVFFVLIVVTALVEFLATGPIQSVPGIRSVGYVVFIAGLVMLWYQAFHEIVFEQRREKWLSINLPNDD